MRSLALLLLVACSEATATADRVPPPPLFSLTPDPPPTVVVIMTDDQRPDLFTRAIMPLTFAALVDSGTTYTNAHANTPVCCPSRASFLTGKPQHLHGVLNNAGVRGGAPAFDASRTIATDLQARGWLTALHGKYMNLYIQMPQPHIPPGWSEWRVPLMIKYWGYELNSKPFDSTFRKIAYPGTLARDHSTNVFKRSARDLILRTPPTQPLFLMITPYAPHKPSDAQLSDRGSCNNLAFTPVLEGDVTDKPSYVQALPAITPTQVAALKADWRKQCETLRGVDRLVDEVVAALRKTGRIHNATVIFTSDNGFLMGEHRLFERKHSVYATAVPLVIRQSGVAPAVVHAPVSLLDVAATIRHAAGLSPSSYGTALVNGAVPADVTIEHMVVTPARENFTALRTGDWLYVEYPTGGVGGAPFRELYDLRADPQLLQNRAGDVGLFSVQGSLATTLALRRTAP
jgi:N-acetylglucosamine-6-sulfatase